MYFTKRLYVQRAFHRINVVFIICRHHYTQLNTPRSSILVACAVAIDFIAFWYMKESPIQQRNPVQNYELLRRIPLCVTIYHTTPSHKTTNRQQPTPTPANFGTACAASKSVAMAVPANLSTTVHCVTNRLNLYGRNKLNN